MQSAKPDRGTDTVSGFQADSAASDFCPSVSVQSLVFPVSESEFYARYWEKAPLIIHRQTPCYYGDLFSLQDFDEAIIHGPGYVKTAEASTNLRTKHYGTSAPALENVMADMHNGRTLILVGLQEIHPRLGLMCRLLAQEVGARFETNSYLTPPNGKGFSPHWDNHDVFILQIAGTKHWKVEKRRRTFPRTDVNIADEDRELRGELYEFTLRPGDTVYIPRGFVHAAEAGAESSLHVTLGIYYNSWDELMRAALKAAIAQDDNLRLALPAGHMKGDGAAIVKRVSEAFRRIADPAFLAGVLEQFRDEIVQKAPLDISGQVAAYFEPKPLELSDQVGARPGLFYNVRKGAETVTLKVGTRNITFADFFGEALQFALETQSFRVQDLPGGLEDELKLVFIERLMQEALVVRKQAAD